MRAFKPSRFALLMINGKQLYAFALGLTAYFIWPTSAEWMGLGLVSILLGLASLPFWKDAFDDAIAFIDFEKDQDEFTGQGSQVKSSALASNETLDKAGVIKDVR